MSLINRMLQDLEKRQPAGEASPLPSGVTASVAPKAGTRWGRIAIALAATVVAVFGIRMIPAQKPAAQVVAMQAEPVVPVAAPAAAAADAMPAATPTPAMPPQAAPSEPAPAAAAEPPKADTPRKESSAERLRRERLEARQEAARRKVAAAVGARDKAAPRIQKSATVTEPGDVLYQQAVEAFSQGRSVESIEQLRQALAVNAAHAPARQLLTKQLLEQRRLDEARSVLRDGARLQPGQLQWSTLLARLELERGDAAAARQAIDAALPQAAGSADFQSLAGAVAQRQGRPDESAEFYRRALQLKPSDGRAWIGLGVALDAEGHRPEAREAFRRALATEALSPELEALAQRKLH